MQRTQTHRPGRQGGFTLVEMAIVMVIIALILGAIMIGRDAQRNAEYLRIKQQFINQWELAYNQYFTHRHAVIGDSLSNRQGMVNGEDFAAKGGRSGGDMSKTTEPNAICEVQPANPIARTAGLGRLRNFFLGAGIELPNGRAATQEDRYVYMDSKGNPQEIQICFQWNRPGSPSGAGNVMVITGLTPDLARSLDQSIDNAIDPAAGRFRQEGVTARGAAGALAGGDWTLFNFDIQGSPGAASSADTGRDAQVATVVAHYKMLQ